MYSYMCRYTCPSMHTHAHIKLRMNMNHSFTHTHTHICTYILTYTIHVGCIRQSFRLAFSNQWTDIHKARSSHTYIHTAHEHRTHCLFSTLSTCTHTYTYTYTYTYPYTYTQHMRMLPIAVSSARFLKSITAFLTGSPSRTRYFEAGVMNSSKVGIDSFACVLHGWIGEYVLAIRGT